jgi:mevalonate kinase
MKNVFKANGKLLISGEYLLMRGAKALAVPLLLKHSLVLEKSTDDYLHWTALHPGGVWFDESYSLPHLKSIKNLAPEKSEFLRNLLLNAVSLNTLFAEEIRAKKVTTTLDWDINWGLGSSSSLIALIAQWAKIDPYSLHLSVSSGSGYDVFCASSPDPIIYSRNSEKPVVQTVPFMPTFHDMLYLVFLEKKQNSANAVSWFNSTINVSMRSIDEISRLSEVLLHAGCLDDFMIAMKAHEKLIGEVLGLVPVKQRLFPDFQGEIK